MNQNDDQAVLVLVYFCRNSSQEGGPAGSFSDPREVYRRSPGGHNRHLGGLTDAADVIETEDGPFSKKEMKKEV